MNKAPLPNINYDDKSRQNALKRKQDKRDKEIAIILVENRWNNTPALNYTDLLQWYEKEAVDGFCEKKGVKPEDLGTSDKSFEEQEDFIYKDKQGKEKVSIDNVTDFLMKKFTFKTIYGVTNERVFIYENGIYILKGREIIKEEIENLINHKARINVVNEVYEKIKRKTGISKDEFHYINEGLVCLENGIYDLNNKKFIEHTPEHYFKTKLPIYYDEKADCPNVKKFFEDILYQEDNNLIQEWFGFNLYNRYFEKKAVIFFGETNTGKTITIDLLSNFIGEKNVCSLSLQNISYGKSFDLLDLKDKYSNIYDDLGDKDINDTGGFKIATGGSSITGEEKFGDRINFRTFAKLTFATNKIPAIKDVDDDAYYLRWVPISLDNQIKEENQDKDLLQKLTTKEELSGLFNWALEGFIRLRKNNRFSFNKKVEEIKDIMQRSSHPLTAFVQDCLDQEQGHRITKELMFKVYSEWILKNNKARFTKTKLSQNLERFCPFIIASKDTDRVWLNAKFKGIIDTYDTFKKPYSEFLKSNNKDKNKDSKKYVIGFEKSDLSVLKNGNLKDTSDTFYNNQIKKLTPNSFDNIDNIKPTKPGEI